MRLPGHFQRRSYKSSLTISRRFHANRFLDHEVPRPCSFFLTPVGRSHTTLAVSLN